MPGNTRGPYFKYLNCVDDINIPRQTIFSKRRKIESKRIERERNEAELFEDDVDMESTSSEFSGNSDLDGSIFSDIESENDSDQNDSDQDAANVLPSIDFDDFQRVHESLECTVKEAMNIIYAYSIRHHLNWTEIEDLVQLVNTIIGKNSLPASKYLFKKMFLQEETELDVHICCEFCYKYLGRKADIIRSNLKTCENCKSSVDVNTKYKKNYFITIDVESHIKDILQRNEEILIMNKMPSENGTICDVYDSSSYKKLREKAANCDFITLTINTDGANVFKSTRHKSLWPILYFVNEMSIDKRFKRENILCAGLAFGKTPNMSVFLRTFIEAINRINTNGGIEIKTAENEVKKIKVFPSIVSTDTRAKEYVLNKGSCNGYFGCCYCMHPGTLIEGTKQVRYCIRGNAEDRTNETVKNDMIAAHMSKMRTNGYNGLSALLGLNIDFDISIQVASDKMHNLDLGVIKKMFSLFLDNKSRGQE